MWIEILLKVFAFFKMKAFGVEMSLCYFCACLSQIDISGIFYQTHYSLPPATNRHWNLCQNNNYDNNDKFVGKGELL